MNPDWIYRQTTGEMARAADGEIVSVGYSGHGAGVNNSALQNVPFVGPCPQGFYLIGDLYDSLTHGKSTRKLIPVEGTNTFGRDDLEEHGDEVTHPGQHLASLGCIIQPLATRIENAGILQVVE